MSLVQKLLLRLFAYLALPGACAWYLASTGFPLLGVPGAAAWAAAAALTVFAAGAAVALAALVAPVRRALDMPPGEARARGALAALKLPGRYAVMLLALACVLLANLCAHLVRRGLAPGLAVAGGGPPRGAPPGARRRSARRNGRSAPRWRAGCSRSAAASWRRRSCSWAPSRTRAIGSTRSSPTSGSPSWPWPHSWRG